ncbi:hypothetical protein [Sphingobacterium sp. HMA12]|uniref:hypothetical protein n=1 Tax=Sphingobacterium sp. HMA12 TaxID=2050894 RepID=UPI000CEA6B35|nr:hypothetical protein [Sphingobacterium sp. HMA12]
MNLKRIFGAVLTILGITGLGYVGYEIIQKNSDYTTLIVIGVLGLLFFYSGISLVRNTKDEA